MTVQGGQPAGYSGTPQLRKLGIVAGRSLVLVAEPSAWAFNEPLPDGVEMRPRAGPGSVDILLSFVREPADLAGLTGWGERIFPAGAIWVAWPRKAAGHVSDVTENLIRDQALAIGLVDVKVAAIDADWSGLKLVWRKERRTDNRSK
jgi:hypothetical protein